MEEPVVFAFALPAVAIVAIVRGDDHEPALLVEEAADVHLGAFLDAAIALRMSLPGDAIIPAALALARVRRLQFVERPLEVEDRVENGMVHRQVHPFTLREDALELRGHAFPLPFAPEIIEHEKAAVE